MQDSSSVCTANSLLVCVDLQNDFIDGTLGTPEAQSIIDACVKRIAAFPGRVVYTLDEHFSNYLETQEGRNLPVLHCQEHTPGQKLHPAIADALLARDARGFSKHYFGSVDLAHWAAAQAAQTPFSSVLLIGICTDICVLSNAMLLKAALPETPIYVDSSCCAGVTPKKHEAALSVLESCQIYDVAKLGK